MPSVSGASGSNEASQIQSQQQTEDIAAQKKLDAAQVDQQTAQQNDQAQQLMGQQSAQQSMLPQQVAGLDGGPSMASEAAQRLQGPAEVSATKSVVGTVMAALAGAMTSMGSQQSSMSNGGGDEHQQGQSGMGGMSSAMSNFGSTSLDDQAQARIKEAATVECYQGISDMLNTMQGRRAAKENIGNVVSMYNQILSKKWEGKKMCPVFEFDEKTGQMKKTGMKEMTHEEATAERDKWKDKKDSISEMGEMDMLMLQQLMDKKTQLEQMISNVMKAGYEGGQAAVQALKAS